MKDFACINRRKINKAVFLLLQKYHRTHGLSVLFGAKQPGNDYIFFYSKAVRNRDNTPKYVIDMDSQYCLTTYQEYLAIPGWSKEGKVYHEDFDKRELHTNEIVEWYERQLTIRSFLDDYQNEIDLWRDTYHVSESEPYLFTWNVLGLFSSRLDCRILSPRLHEKWDEDDLKHNNKLLLEIGCTYPKENLNFCDSYVFISDGRVFHKENQSIAWIWKDYLRGKSVERIVDDLIKGRIQH